MIRSPIKAVVFDFDGVILESADIKTAAFLELYAGHGAEVVEKVRSHHLANLGISRFKKFAWIAEHILHAPLSEGEMAALGQRFAGLALEKVLAAPFVPGAVAALARLAGSHPLFVASGTPQEELVQIIEHRGLRERFSEIHGSPTEKPTILRDIMRRHGYAPAEILFIGDGISDFEAAVATGIHFLARDTPALHSAWLERGVRREPDLVRLPELVDGPW